MTLHRWLLMGLVFASSSAVSAADPPKKLNVLFLMSDDMRPELGCYGRTHVQSPNLDALAKSGMRFDRAYCQYPLCNPSRTSMLTGRHPLKTGVIDNTVYFRDAHLDWQTIPGYFKANGYATLRTGKIFHGGIDDAPSWTEGAEPPKKNPAKKVDPKERAKQSDRIVVLAGDGESHNDFRTADRAVELLRKYKDQPFFLACGFTKPHSPPSAPQRFLDLYDTSKITLPKTFQATPASPDGFPKAAITQNGDLFIGREATEAEARKVLGAYYASISWTDWNIGRVLAELDKLGLRESTIIVFWGDHGYHLGEFGKWSKHGSLFDIGTHVPLLISAPKTTKPRTSFSGNVQSLDIYPTLCELCGLKIPDGLDGHSLAAVLKDPGAAWDHAAYSVAGNRKNLGLTIRTNRYRYAEWSRGDNGALLIDYESDPLENKNRADDPKLAKVKEELSAQLRKYFATP